MARSMALMSGATLGGARRPRTSRQPCRRTPLPRVSEFEICRVHLGRKRGDREEILHVGGPILAALGPIDTRESRVTQSNELLLERRVPTFAIGCAQ